MPSTTNASRGTTASHSPQKVPVSVYHACFLTEACKDHLIQLNGLLHGLDCSVGLEPTPAKEEIFSTRPTVIFDAAERTEVKALLSKSAFSVRMTTTKTRHFDLKAKVPFCGFSLGYESLDEDLSEEHKTTASAAVMRNLYHARVSIQAGFKHLSTKFIEDIDHALGTGATKEEKVAALTEVFNSLPWWKAVHLSIQRSDRCESGRTFQERAPSPVCLQDLHLQESDQGE